MSNSSAKQRALLGGTKNKREICVVIRPFVQFLRVVLRAEDVDWHFKRQEWAEESLRIETIVTEKSMCTGRETPCAVRTVGQKTNSRLKLKCAIGLFFHAFL